MIEKIKELRTQIPVPMSEAMALLKSNGGDIDTCVALFKAKSIQQICELTGCDETTAAKYYEAEKFDFNRTVSSIKDAIYDENYKAIDGVTKENIRIVIQWLGLVEAEDFTTSLDFNQFDVVQQTLIRIPEFSDFAVTLKKVKESKDRIFEGYSDEQSIDEFVRRHKQLDDDRDFEEANQIMTLSRTVFKEKLLRHLRNL